MTHMAPLPSASSAPSWQTGRASRNIDACLRRSATATAALGNGSRAAGRQTSYGAAWRAVPLSLCTSCMLHAAAVSCRSCASCVRRACVRVARWCFRSTHPAPAPYPLPPDLSPLGSFASFVLVLELELVGTVDPAASGVCAPHGGAGSTISAHVHAAGCALRAAALGMTSLRRRFAGSIPQTYRRAIDGVFAFLRSRRILALAMAQPVSCQQAACSVYSACIRSLSHPRPSAAPCPSPAEPARSRATEPAVRAREPGHAGQEIGESRSDGSTADRRPETATEPAAHTGLRSVSVGSRLGLARVAVPIFSVSTTAAAAAAGHCCGLGGLPPAAWRGGTDSKHFSGPAVAVTRHSGYHSPPRAQRCIPGH